MPCVPTVNGEAFALSTLFFWSIGAPGLIGYDRRPVFTYPRYTMHMLEHVIVRAKITNSGWGNDIIPDNKLVETSAADAMR